MTSSTQSDLTEDNFPKLSANSRSQPIDPAAQLRTMANVVGRAFKNGIPKELQEPVANALSQASEMVAARAGELGTVLNSANSKLLDASRWSRLTVEQQAPAVGVLSEVTLYQLAYGERGIIRLGAGRPQPQERPWAERILAAIHDKQADGTPRIDEATFEALPFLKDLRQVELSPPAIGMDVSG